MINYIIQIIFFQVVFLAVYDLFLKKETFFKWNRFYLLATPILSFIIPFLKIDSFRTATTQEYIVLLPEIVLNPQTLIIQAEGSSETISNLTILTYVGIAIFAIVFLCKLVKIIRLIIQNKITNKENYKLVLLENEQTAFSFFNYIFVGEKLYQKQELQIIQHELVHSRQYHTLDLLFFEFLKIIMWFNPMVYLYQKRITLLHEYISDAEVVKQTDKSQYFNNLLKETFNIENISFINQFYKHSLIKKRIIMITKAKSKSVKQLKYLLLIPILGSMLFYISCTTETAKEDVITENDANKIEKLINAETELVEIVESYESFSRVDVVPKFPGCEGDEQEMKKCFNSKMIEHVSNNFNTKIANDLKLDGKQKIYVKFFILLNGEIQVDGVRAAHEELSDEARRVINLLPKMVPGEKNGEKVNVAYILPIMFDVK